MHEYAIAYDLYATSRKTAIEHKASRVNKVSVEVGAMAMVNPEQVVFLFDTIKEDDPLFKTTLLECHEVLPQTRCSCGYSGQESFVGPGCGALPELVKGREIMVTSVELEVDD
jgi:hydrogenase nickel incorporation protein HypA/HybF